MATAASQQTTQSESSAAQSAAGAADGNSDGYNSSGGSGKINVTYETIFDLVVREKGKEELQQLNPGFFTDLVSYLNEKKAMLNILGAEEKERAARQLQNINRLIKELYERREKKIISMALARSRAGADIIDTATLLTEEKAMFDNLVRQLDIYREGVLNSLLTARMPKTSGQAGEEMLAAATGILTKQPTSAISGTKNIQENAAEEGKETKLVRFLHAVPKFVGKELEVYGPFDADDVANLPREIADVLILKARAEEIGESG